MKTLLLNIFLAFVWVSLTGDFSPAAFIFGFVLSYLLLLLFHNTLPISHSYFSKFWQIIYFVVYFVWELLIANVRVAWEVLTPRHHMSPAIIAIPLDLESDVEISLLANLITLTPGTLSLDVSTDKKTLYVHSMYVDIDDIESFKLSIKNGFEKRVRELFK